MNAFAEYEKWLSADTDAETKKELESMKGNEEEIRMRFGSSLAFGTAGLRGVMGAGINNMNVYTVGRATQGLAEYIISEGGGSVVIACDTRNNSKLFSCISAEIMAGNGIKTYIFDGPRPTPELSFALRHYGCIAGINVTASHNPKEYNGYKVYWKDGAQIGLSQADTIAAIMERTDLFTGVRKTDFDLAVKDGLITVIGNETDEAYLSNVLAQIVDKDVIPSQSDMKIVYTPLHGAGRLLVPEALKRAGLKTVLTVPEQMIPDGNFPTVAFPNPEFPEAFNLAEKIAEANGCDLIIATDPDSDRMGLMVRSGDGYETLTGNQTGCLLLDYVITALKKTGLPADAYAVKTIVTTELASIICRANGVKIHDVLTGFKFIGEVIKKHEAKGEGTYLLGFEESYGYLKGTYARDKDGVVASVIAAEMAAYYRSKGMTLRQAIDSLYERYGYFKEKASSKAFPGSDGKEKMAAFMDKLRSDSPKTLGGEDVISVRDYLKGTITDCVTGEEEPTGLPSSNVLYFKTKTSVVVVRPSGTEPKVKFYYMASGENAAAAAEKTAELMSEMAILSE